MGRIIKILLVIGIAIFFCVIGEIVWRYIDEDYANKIKMQTWANRIAEYKEDSNKLSLDEKLLAVFGGVDSSRVLKSIGCVQGFFGYINSEYLIKIPSSIYTESESYKEYDLAENSLYCELLIFPPDSAHLANICTDIIIMNYPKPERTIKSSDGKVKVLMIEQTNLSGRQINKAFIEIEHIEFLDTLNNNRKIDIKNKLLWEVLYLGTPG